MRHAPFAHLRAVALAGAAFLGLAACSDATGPGQAAGPLSGRIVFAFDSTVISNTDVTMGAASIAPDGSDRRRIARVPGPGLIRQLLVSGNGQRFAMRRGRTVWTFRSNGLQMMAAEALDDAFPETWTPDGERLLWLRPPPVFEQAVYTSAPDGRERQDLAVPSYGTLRQLRFARATSGYRLVFEARENALRDVFVANRDGTSPRRVTDERSNYQFPEPSPDGRRIAFRSEGGLTEDGFRTVGVSVVEAAGGPIIPLLDAGELGPAGTYLVFVVSWSPDGSRLAAYAEAPGTGIWIVDAAGSSAARLVWAGPGDVSGMSWSPTGDRLVVSHRSDPGHQADWDLTVLDVDSGALTNITRTDGVDEIFPVWLP